MKKIIPILIICFILSGCVVMSETTYNKKLYNAYAIGYNKLVSECNLKIEWSGCDGYHLGRLSKDVDTNFEYLLCPSSHSQGEK